ncbi:MAG: hypothetical protein RLZ98_1969 [Pseudomonadota bacterium]|jgi:uncharacterized phage protein (TIGR02216 family)
MAIGLGVLRLRPKDFWRMSVAELTAATEGLIGGSGAPRPPGRQEFAALMARFPDKEMQGDG